MKWDELAAFLSASGVDSVHFSGAQVGQLALSWIIGENRTEEFVEEFISYGQYSELARSILLALQSPKAVEFCVDVLNDASSAPYRRHLAARLLCDIGNEKVIPSIGQWLDDTDTEIQRLSARIAEDYVFRGILTEPGNLLSHMESHSNPHVRDHAKQISNMLKDQIT